MSRPRKKRKRLTSPPCAPRAASDGKMLQSYTVGALPIVNHVLRRMNLQMLLERHLPPDDRRTKISTASGLLLLVRNVLLSREPIYGVSEWAARHAPHLLGLSQSDLACLNDDRLGRCLDRLFDGTGPELLLAVVRHVVGEFGLSLEELHNDSTTVSFYGAYPEAAEEGLCRGRRTAAITYGHSKDHRPDLKQLLYILTVADDGGVPVYFTSANGNTVDDQTHCDTWDLLRELVGRPDFLYVADCKLASTENLGYIARRGGRFVTILPATRTENTKFRQWLCQHPGKALWEEIHQVKHQRSQEVVDRLSVFREERSSSEGYRLLWFYSTGKAERDQAARLKRTQRTLAGLESLRERLAGPRTRLRERSKVEEAVAEILDEFEVTDSLTVQIEEQQEATFRQAKPGRPGQNTRYVKQVKKRCVISWQIDMPRVMGPQPTDGVFPLITNALELSPKDVLLSYKRQPIIEKRFSQLKTDFEVAPLYLKSVSRIQALLCVYFLVLLVQTLLERELRHAMHRAKESHLPLYPEGRECHRPTTRRLIDLFEPVQRHVLTLANGKKEIFVTELTPVQRKILRLLKLSPKDYGH